ncbi:hypothetical protein RRG08_063299 [Elysia crispata]|uniref:Uncharacterized protein n=1 Tax=Elysia crispata TaxID=231223 RepID=A0AAE0Y5A7_9GAST|nr:hypothetical protein RRG08_063299 [Elysia crispata]
MKRGSPSFVVITVTSHSEVRRHQSVSVGSSTGNANSLYLWALAQEMPTVCICGLQHRKCQQSVSVGSSTGNANSLYLWALAQEMPTHRKCQQSVSVGSSTGNANSLYLWALPSTRNVNSLYLWALAQEIQTEHPVRDDSLIIFSQSSLTSSDDYLESGLRRKSFLELHQAMVEITLYLNYDVGVNVVEMYACQWKRMKEEEQDIEDFIQSWQPQSASQFLSSSSITTKSCLRF